MRLTVIAESIHNIPSIIPLKFRKTSAVMG